MLERPVITLTTDFGLKDPFVGIMKGVIRGLNPMVEIIDISHNIGPQNIFEASQVLAMSHKYFPAATIHVVIVDPGVGGVRRPLLVVNDDYYFIGPDNGVFTPIYNLERRNIFKVIHLSAAHYYFSPDGATFHGRDIFAPAAAWLAKGVDSSKFGDEISDYVTLEMPKPKITAGNTLEGEVVHIDGFGNAITNIDRGILDEVIPAVSRKGINISCKNKTLSLVNYYSDAGGSELSAVANSFGRLEIFVYKGSAAEKFGIKVGDKVSVSIL